MFESIPENYRHKRRTTRRKAGAIVRDDKNARRPPELLTRDHVSRCIVREIKEGRGSPHGGVFLDISWIKRKLPNAEEHIKRKLPSMYHQFKQLATSISRSNRWKLDRLPITSWVACVLIRIRKCRDCLGCSLPVNARPVSTARIDSAAIRSPIFWCSGNEPENLRRSSRSRIRYGEIDNDKIDM